MSQTEERIELKGREGTEIRKKTGKNRSRRRKRNAAGSGAAGEADRYVPQA
jgi:hypothetical protein